MDNSFRRLPVDNYSEDLIKSSDLYEKDSRNPLVILEETKSKHLKIKNYLQSNQIKLSLELILINYPFGEDVEEAKAIALSSIISILNSTKSTEISSLVSSLTSTEQVTLMKYLYKVMENLGETSGNVVLGWHEKLVECAGTGCIVRVMTDRRRV